MLKMRTTLSILILTLAIPFALAQPQTSSPASVEKRVDALLSRMTLEEKIELIGGTKNFFTRPIPRLGIPSLRMSDGPLGVHDYGPTTAYTAGIALAASWDSDLARRVGTSMGRDARARGVNIVLAPALNIYRAPMNGRNFEYFGEDPYLASRMAVSVVEGMQSQGVIATVKHFVANNMEYDRHHINAVVDERTLHEIYLPAFEAAVREAHAGAVMDAYNLVNGEHMTQNAYLNIDILKKEWGFDGILMSDWGATYDAVTAANAGLDLEMPSPRYMTRANLLPAIQQGKVTAATIDDKVRRILRKAIQFCFFDRDQKNPNIPLDDQRSDQVAREEARGSMVLLKNDGNLLPLDKTKLKTIAVLGPDAYPAVIGGGGSSQTEPFHQISFLEGVTNYLGTSVKVLHPAVFAKNVLDPQMKSVVATADAVILCVGFSPDTEGEGADRTFALPSGQDDLIRQVAGLNKNVVVVITAGGNVDMTGWIDSVPAILHAWYPGQEGGAALADILFGDFSPSGKLPASFERRWQDNPVFHSYYEESGKRVPYTEGIFLGYRYYDRSSTKPLFPFGFGLSYTHFQYSHLRISPGESSSPDAVTVSFDVKNAGDRAGAEVAELYVGDSHASVPRPVKELKGFAKVFLRPSEKKEVTLTLNRRSFSYYDVKNKQWTAEPGDFSILVGSSSAQIELTGSFVLTR
ncbi:MAG: glycoside hydrolase family 3 C-terminal domain-containing protein [Candidatus Acidiferrales bacterium]